MKVPFGYLKREAIAQRGSRRGLWKDIRRLVRTGDFTLGEPLQSFERAFAKVTGYKHAIGVNSGTDALAISLMCIGNYGGVITVPNTFYATVGAIYQSQGYPIFCDVGPDYLMDWSKRSNVVRSFHHSPVIPVAWAGHSLANWHPPEVSEKEGHKLILDNAQAIGTPKPAFAHIAACYSLHPLKNVHVWGDG